MISAINISKKYKVGNEDFFAINNLSLEIKEGEFVAIVGKSGSGKSTLLNLIGTLDCVSSGNIVIDESNVSSFNNRKLAEFRNGKLGFVFQSFYLEPEYTVYENVELPLILAGRFGKQNKEKITQVLKLVGLSDKYNSKVKILSGGECQRVAIARAIVNNPTYILADEPCGNLDTDNSKNVMNILCELHNSGKTIIMVTHDEEESQVAQRIITISDGRIVKDEKNILFN